MNEWLELLVALTFAGNTVVLCMLLLRFVPVRVFTAKWQYRMGKLAIMFYLFPIVIVLQQMPTQVAKAPMGLIHTDFSTIAPLALGLTRSVQTLSVTLALVLFSLWLLGVLVVGLWQVYSYVQFRRWQHKGIFPVSELDELKILKRVDSNAAFLIAVNPSDEKRFSPEEWQNILAQIERGEVFWEDSPELKEYKAKVERGEMTWSEVRAVQKNNK